MTPKDRIAQLLAASLADDDLPSEELLAHMNTNAERIADLIISIGALARKYEGDADAATLTILMLTAVHVVNRKFAPENWGVILSDLHDNALDTLTVIREAAE